MSLSLLKQEGSKCWNQENIFQVMKYLEKELYQISNKIIKLAHPTSLLLQEGPSHDKVVWTGW
jgi:hypothetical protein